MTIKQQGGIFGRNPTFNDVDVDGTLNIDGSASFSSGVTIVNASRITGTDNAVPLLDLRANNTGGGTKNTLRFFDDDGSADNGQQAGRIEFYTDDNTNTGIHSYINSETNTTGYGTIKIGTGLAGSAVDRLTIASGGSVTVNTGNLVIGTSGKGIDFSATSGTGTSELLNDYEEGTYAPSLYGNTTGSGTTLPLSSAYNTLAYTKIGRQVTITGKLETNGSHSASGYLILTVPFVVADLSDTAGGAAGSVFFYRTGQLHTNPSVITVEGNSYVIFYENTAGGDVTAINAQDMDAAIEVFFGFTYFTT